jgi:NosR/NirI family nitrous oxide reductase transcriptional regulator
VIALAQRYIKWLHTQWPAGKVEKLPVVREDGSTNVPGLSIVGDLTGIPLLKFSADTGAKAVGRIADDTAFAKRKPQDGVLDIAIIGGGVSGHAAALEAQKRGLSYQLFEAAEPFSTIVNFPKGKPIYTYPTDMTPAGDISFESRSDVKEDLLETLDKQTAGIDITAARVSHVKRTGGIFEVHFTPKSETRSPKSEIARAHRVIVGIGRSGNFRKLGVPGEDLDKVYNRLHDPADFCGQNILVVGGGDSAMETAIALASCGSHVTLSYRKPQFSRPKPENIEKLAALANDPQSHVDVETVDGDRVTTPSGQYMHPPGGGSVTLMMASNIKSISDGKVEIQDADGNVQSLDNDAVFSMIGREPPLDFFRRSGVEITGERTPKWWLTISAMFLLCFWMYHWKGDYNIPLGLKDAFNSVFGLDVSGMRDLAGDKSTLLGTIAHSMSSRSFYYTLAYATCVLMFGIRRIRRRKTPYVTRQTITLTAIQILPLFLLPEIILPYLNNIGAFDAGAGAWLERNFFSDGQGNGDQFWRAYGLVLAWPLMAWNWFTDAPIWGWLILGFIQTFVLIPLMIRRWGKGAYCGWICSCGALAETMGDAHRHKMPHGPMWNRVNLIGQAFLIFATGLMVLRVIGWSIPGDDFADASFNYLAKGSGLPILNYAYFVDLMFAGILGVAFYFHFSGRVWCRFACPLAALMHIYARFSQFRILADKKKCISCNVCTSVCHQGIDIMNFANKGLGMEDPQCVRCSACVQSCPTGVLSFGRVDKHGNEIGRDTLAASPVQMAELTVNGRSV